MSFESFSSRDTNRKLCRLLGENRKQLIAESGSRKKKSRWDVKGEEERDREEWNREKDREESR